MAPQKETIMVLKVDLDCPRCYKKVKKLLCQFHQIHDQVYNAKQNTVMIKVLCCSPEKIRDKLCCKGGKSIKSIEILEPKKPPPPPPPAEKHPPEKPADQPPAQPPPPVEKPKEKPSPPPPPPAEPAPAPPADPNPNPNPPEKLKKNSSKNGSRKNGSPKPEKPPEEAPPPPPEPKPDPPPQKPAERVPQADPVQCYPVYQVNPVSMCCPECYAGHTTGPCYQGYGYGSYGYGVPPPAPPAGGWGYYGGGGYSGYSNNYKPGYCVSRCGDYISDENPTACVIM